MLTRSQLSNADALELCPNKILQRSQWILYILLWTLFWPEYQVLIDVFCQRGFRLVGLLQGGRASHLHLNLGLWFLSLPLLIFLPRLRWLTRNPWGGEGRVPGLGRQLCWGTRELYSVFRETPQLCSHKTHGIGFCANSCPFVKIWTLTALPMASGTSVLQIKPISCWVMNGSWVSTFLRQAAATPEIQEWMDIKLYEKTNLDKLPHVLWSSETDVFEICYLVLVFNSIGSHLDFRKRHSLRSRNWHEAKIPTNSSLAFYAGSQSLLRSAFCEHLWNLWKLHCHTI